jgi:uncharacterized membrane protein YdcZ (DUF606 family)
VVLRLSDCVVGCSCFEDSTVFIGILLGLSGGQNQRLEAETAETFAATINKLSGKVTMIFITHTLPKQLVVDEVFEIEKGKI